MQTTLFLTDDEQKLFMRLSPALREGWEVQSETIGYQDSPKKMQRRIEAMDIVDTRFREAAADIREGAPLADLLSLADTMPLSHMSEADMREVFYALGPLGISAIVRTTLESASTDEDILQAQAHCMMRHLLFHTA